VDFELKVVTVDLDTVGLEDVLAFKRESAGARHAPSAQSWPAGRSASSR
jgi:hypothetical protein